MKQFLILLLIPFFMAAQNNDNNWLYDFELAKKEAKKEKNNILVYFTGSDWCGPCIKLKKDLFETNDFKEVAKEYTLVYVDIPRNKDLLSTRQMDHNSALLSKLNKKGVFPLLKVLTNKEKVLDEYSGYSMTGDITYHLDFLKRNQ